MNWLKRATRAISFSPEVEQQIRETTILFLEWGEKYYAEYGYRRDNEFIAATSPFATITLPSYQNEVNVSIHPPNDVESTFQSRYNKISGIWLNMHLMPKDKSQCAGIIKHELVHAVDPQLRYNREKNRQNMGTPYNDYVTQSGEVNARTTQILSVIHPDEAPEIMEWLRKSAPQYPATLSQFEKTLDIWRQEPDIWRQFRVRLYNHVSKLTHENFETSESEYDEYDDEYED